MHTPAQSTLLQARNVVQKHKAIARTHATDLVSALTPEQLLELIEIGVAAAGLPDAAPAIQARIDAVLSANDPRAQQLHELEVRERAEAAKRRADEQALADAEAHNEALREELARLRSPLPVVGEGPGVRGLEPGQEPTPPAAIPADPAAASEGRSPNQPDAPARDEDAPAA